MSLGLKGLNLYRKLDLYNSGMISEFVVTHLELLVILAVD